MTTAEAEKKCSNIAQIFSPEWPLVYQQYPADSIMKYGESCVAKNNNRRDQLHQLLTSDGLGEGVNSCPHVCMLALSVFCNQYAIERKSSHQFIHYHILTIKHYTKLFVSLKSLLC